MLFDNAVLSNIQTPIPKFYPRHITLLIDSKFNVLYVEGLFAQIYFQNLKIGTAIDQHFDFEGMHTLDDLPGGSGSFPSKPQEHFTVAAEPFYTTFPFASLHINKAKEGLYLGSVSISNLFPNFFPEQLSTIIYTNQNGLLLGFNDSFFRFYQPHLKKAAEMLNQPLSGFMSPTPQEIQQQALKDDAVNRFEEFQEAFRFPDIRGKSWAHSGNSNAQILFLFPDFEKSQDFILEVECRVVAGSPPLLLCGFPSPSEDPEDYGYLAGTYELSNESLLKKNGFKLVTGNRLEKKEGKTVLRLCLSGQSLFYYQDNTLLCAYFDPHLYTGLPVKAGLGLRPGSECVLEGLRLLVRPKKTPNPARPKMNMVVALKSRPVQYFQLNRFYNFSLTSAQVYADVAGYILQDVTHLQHTISKLSYQYKKTLSESESLKKELKEQRTASHAFIGSSPAVQSVKSKAMVISQSQATVLIQGATGTGKEVLANFIHLNSPFSEGPFVKVDCSSLPRDLIESELFGHEKGAFTGAAARKIGKFEMADKGTLFLDEISNLTPAIQVKLLHFLQDFTITRIGGNTTIPLKLRIVAAANIPLTELVSKGLFREDLYYRLCVMVIQLPLLRQRKEDLLEICDHYIRKFSEASGKSAPRLSQEAYLKLHNHSWPGNIRELTNVIQRAVIFCQGNEITPDLILFEEESGSAGRPVIASSHSHGAGQKAPRKLLYADKEELFALLKKHRGNIGKSAQELDVSPRALYYYVHRENLDLKKMR